MAAHAFNLSTALGAQWGGGVQRQVSLWELETGLVYIVSPKTARAT